MSHSTLLHRDTKFSDVRYENRKSVNTSEQALVASGTCEQSVDGTKLHKVVPVKVWTTDPANYVLTYCFLDEGSEASVCTKALARRLGAKLANSKMRMCTNNAITNVNLVLPEMHIQGVNEPDVFPIKETLVQKTIIDVNSSIPSKRLAEAYPHLRDLTFPELPDGRVELLIGQNVQNAFRFSEWRYGDSNAPFGYHTAPGWALWGIDHCQQKDSENIHSVRINFLRVLELHEPAAKSCENVLRILSQEFHDIDLPQ